MHTDILLWNISKQWATSLRSHEMVHILLHKFRIKIILPIYPINYQKKYIFRCFSHTFYIIQQILFEHCPRLYPLPSDRKHSNDLLGHVELIIANSFSLKSIEKNRCWLINFISTVKKKNTYPHTPLGCLHGWVVLPDAYFPDE